MAKYRRNISEAPIDYEGPERMDPSIEKKIIDKTTPYAGHPGLPKLDRDVVEIISSQRFKQSVDNVRRFMGDTSSIQGPPQQVLMKLMQSAMRLFPKIASIEQNHKEFLEKLAVDLVVKEMAIPDGALQFEAELESSMMGAAEGMKGESEEPSPDEIKDAFGGANENADELEAFMDAMEQFDQQKAKRRLLMHLLVERPKKVTICTN